MNASPLRLRQSAKIHRSPEAWLLSGDDASRWLLEIARWGVDESELQLYLLPTSISNLAPSGLFVVVPPGSKPKVLPAGVPFGLIGGSVYLPIDAEMVPAVSQAELISLNRYLLLVLHPSLGPVGFDEKDGFSIADLILPPLRREEDWETAHPGFAAQPRLLSISIRLLTSLDDLFADASASIGSDPISLDETPAKIDPTKLFSETWGHLQEGMLQGLSRTLKAFPHMGSRRTFLNHFEDWINAKLRAHLGDIQKRREKVLDELLEQFQSSPDEALIHALPLVQSALPRGLAPPSPNLGSNTPDFNLKMLGGGKPLDPWKLSAQMQAKLRQQYLKMVERERQLGRHRRAAYIQASLLGNLNAAALLLREGGFFQEAAILYRDHLHQALRAAQCFADAGLNDEAIPIFQQHKAWEELAHLYFLMGEHEKSQAAYRNFVDQLKEKNDYLRAADVLNGHLHARDEALELLSSAWPHHRQALLCAKQYIRWRAFAGEHALTRRFLGRGQAMDNGMSIDLLWLDLLVETKHTYPEVSIQRLAEDLGRLKIVRKFRELRIPSEIQKYIPLLTRLAPEDHLLRRDAYRHLDQARTREVTTVKRAAHSPGKEAPVEVLREFELEQKGFSWMSATTTGDYFFAIAQSPQTTSGGRQICLVRSNFEGAQQNLKWDVQSANHTLPATFACWSQKKSFDRVFLFQPTSADCPLRLMPIADGFPVPVNVLASPVPVREIYSAGFSPAGMLWLCRGTEAGLHLGTFQSERTLVSDISLDLPPPAWPFLPCLSVLENHAALSINQELYSFEISQGLKKERGTVQQFEQPILNLVASPRWTKPHFAVVMPGQVALTWFTGAHAHSYVIDSGFEQPKAAFTTDGILVIVTATGGLLVDCDSKGVKGSNAFSLGGASPIAVMAGAEARTFVTLDAVGKVRVYCWNRSLFRS